MRNLSDGPCAPWTRPSGEPEIRSRNRPRRQYCCTLSQGEEPQTSGKSSQNCLWIPYPVIGATDGGEVTTKSLLPDWQQRQITLIGATNGGLVMTAMKILGLPVCWMFIALNEESSSTCTTGLGTSHFCHHTWILYALASKQSTESQTQMIKVHVNWGGKGSSNLTPILSQHHMVLLTTTARPHVTASIKANIHHILNLTRFKITSLKPISASIVIPVNDSMYQEIFSMSTDRRVSA